MRIELPLGDIVDRVTILQIKIERISNQHARLSCQQQLEEIERVWDGPPLRSLPEYAALRRVNEKLWEIEDALRDHEREGRFDERFIELARSVYRVNDERARIKRAINERLGSRFVEAKQYGSDA